MVHSKKVGTEGHIFVDPLLSYFGYSQYVCDMLEACCCHAQKGSVRN
jgi:hypothetical protein